MLEGSLPFALYKNRGLPISNHQLGVAGLPDRLVSEFRKCSKLKRAASMGWMSSS